MLIFPCSTIKINKKSEYSYRKFCKNIAHTPSKAIQIILFIFVMPQEFRLLRISMNKIMNNHRTIMCIKP